MGTEIVQRVKKKKNPVHTHGSFQPGGQHVQSTANKKTLSKDSMFSTAVQNT